MDVALGLLTVAFLVNTFGLSYLSKKALARVESAEERLRKLEQRLPD